MSVFTDAIRVLEERGWTQEDWQDAEGRVCCAGALCVVRHGSAFDVLHLTGREAVALAHAFSYSPERDLEARIARWNDDPHTTYEDVVSALKQAHYSLELAEAE